MYDLFSPDTPRKSILIVDGEEVVRRTLSLQLQDRGWQVQTVSNANEARTVFAAQPFEVVLIDITLPEASGATLVEDLRNQVSDVIIVLMTGYPTLQSALELLPQEASAYLIKPVRVEQLDLAVERARRELALIREIHELRHTVQSLQAELADISARTTLTEGKEEVEVPEEPEEAIGPAPYRAYAGGVAGRGEAAIASYEKQMHPGAPSSAPEDEEEAPPEEAITAPETSDSDVDHESSESQQGMKDQDEDDDGIGS